MKKRAGSQLQSCPEFRHLVATAGSDLETSSRVHRGVAIRTNAFAIDLWNSKKHRQVLRELLAFRKAKVAIELIFCCLYYSPSFLLKLHCSDALRSPGIYGAPGLANFFLVDHSLINPGGHHADYVSCVAQAATDMGFDTTIGTNAGLSESENLEEYGEVHRSFRRTTYQKDSYLAGLRHLKRVKRDFLRTTKEDSLMRKLTGMVHTRCHHRRRNKFIRGFARDCQKFFESQLFSEGDHAFFTTVSELELMGLAAYLSNHPRTLQLHWHLQFHFNLFDGRTPEYDEQQDVARAIQSCFDAALARIPYHALHFYTTSLALADQYNRLGVGTFEMLPYPVSPAFGKVFSNPTDDHPVATLPMTKRPIRLTCPGGIRREKGHLDYLQPLVNKIWEPHLSTGQVQIAVQRPAKSKLTINLPEARDLTQPPIEYQAHPLMNDEYVDFIKSADCGLLFYDSRVYYSRRAGVLGELLSCGKPVIVPAGSWLSEQIQDSIFHHVSGLVRNDNPVRQIDSDEFTYDPNNVPLPGGVFSFDQERHPFQMSFDRQPHETGMVFSFDWHWPDVPGVFAQITVNQRDSNDQIVSSKRQVVGQRREWSNSLAYFGLSTECCRVEIRLNNAFHDANASIKGVQITTLSSENSTTPLGAVGIIAADQDDLPGCIDELVTHYHHYRKTAEAFAKSWAKQHQPKRTVAHLISTEYQALKAA